MFILLLLFLLPVIVYIFNVNHYKFQNLLYFLKFVFFNIIVLCYSAMYLLYYVVFFVFKNYRFFCYYYQIARVSKLYYKKKSIYFLFWKYLTIFVIANIYNIIVYVLYNIILFFKKYFYINNIFIIILINSKILLLSDLIKQIINVLYNGSIILCYHIFNFINVNWIYLFTKKINFLNRWNNIQDPFLYRNTYIKIIDFFNDWILKVNKNPQLKFTLGIFKNLLKKYILSYIFVAMHRFDLISIEKFYECFINIWIVGYFRLFKSSNSKIITVIALCLFYLNFIFINFIYIFLMSVINFIYIFFYHLWKYKYYFIYIFLIIFCLKYYWFIHYFFLILYKHYTLYIPLFEVKESFRFFNFEWIDLSNYYDLVLLRNTLIDTTVLNNNIYNDLFNNLNQTLYLYGFKVTTKYNIALHSALKNIYNKDTVLLNNMFKVFNENHSYSQYHWYIRMRKIFNHKLKSVYHNYKPKKGLSRRQRRLGEYFYNRLNIATQIHNERNLYIRYFIQRKFPMTQELKKRLNIYSYYTKGYFRKKISKKIVMLNLNHFLKIKKVPLRYTSVHSTDTVNRRLISIYKWFAKCFNKQKSVRLFYKRIKYVANSLKKLINSQDYKFFLGQFLSFKNYGIKSDVMLYKHKIPTFNWTIARWKRKVPNKSTTDFLYMATIDAEHPFMTYRDVPRKKGFLKRNFKFRFIYLHYPFSINQYYDIKRSMNYFGALNNLKILKKYYYIYNTKLYFNKKYYGLTLESNRVFVKQFLYRLALIKKPLNRKYFFKSKKNFWFFFDYMKANKYLHHKYNNIYGDQYYVNFFFIKRARKGYIKLRNDLIRMYSLYFYYRNLERAVYLNAWPIPSSQFELNMRNQDKFDSLKTAWFTYSYLTNERTNVKLFKNIRILNYLFRENFMIYYVYCNHNINSYNIAYHERIDTYKIKVLNKINNLKRFFYFQNKRNNGWSIFKYLNVFSVKYHIKHFLWHNPYSFLIYQNKFLFNNNNTELNLNYIFSYSVNNNIMEFNKYSFIFNLYFNTFEINDNIFNFNELFVNLDFKNYYSFGKSNYKNPSDLEIYRLIMNFINYYYKNFLYRLLRYRYILDYKNYTLFKFFTRYFNISDWFYHSYFRFRFFIHKYIFLGNTFKKAYYRFFKLRYIYSFRVRKLAFLPFWFYFDNFTKGFLYIVLNKFYIKSNFLCYWFYVNYNFNLLYIYIFFYDFKFWLSNKISKFRTVINNINNININYININYAALKIDMTSFIEIFFNYFNITDNERQQCILLFSEYIFVNFIKVLYVFYNNSIVLIEWHYILFSSIINKIMIYLYIFVKFINKVASIEPYIYIKWYITIMLKSYNGILFNIFMVHFNTVLKLYYLNFNVNFIWKLTFNNTIFIKYYITKLFLYYFKIIFNIKNTLVYFKPSYYSFRQQKNLRYTQKFKTYFKSNFVSTRTVRSIYSFKHYTDNMVFLRNINFFNIYNYLYLMHNYDINLLNISTNLYLIFKNQTIFYVILLYLCLYFFVFFLLFMGYRKFYNIYFFCRLVNNDLQDTWTNMFNNEVLLKSTSKKNFKYYKYLWRYKKRQNFYNFFLFNFFMSKDNIIKNFLFKIVLRDKMFNKIQEKLNNNYIINIKNSKFLLDFSTVLYKVYDFMKLVNVNHFNIIKEKKTYNFFFYNLLNSNTFNFCLLYWFIIIPYFFFEYIWMRYHLKGHIRIKRKYFLFLKLFFNNFKWYTQLSRLIGLNNYYINHKIKTPRNYFNGSKYKRKRRLKLGYFFKWDRFNSSLVRLSSLGNYFYWFAHINKWEYFLSYKKYFFNFIYKSNYFSFIYIFVFFFVANLWKFFKKCRI